MFEIFLKLPQLSVLLNCTRVNKKGIRLDLTKYIPTYFASFMTTQSKEHTKIDYTFLNGKMI